MKLKFLSFDLGLKKSRHVDSYLNKCLKRLDCTEFITEPSDDFYILVCHISNLSWWTTPHQIDNKILSDIQNRKCAIILNHDGDGYGLYGTHPDYLSRDNLFLIKKSIEFLRAHYDLTLYSDCSYHVNKYSQRHNIKSLFLDSWTTVVKVLDHSDTINKIKNLESRPYKFLYLGGKPRPYRLRYYEYINSLEGFKENSLQSTGSGTFFCPYRKKNIFIPPKILDMIEVTNRHGVTESQAIDTNEQFHHDSYINIVPMTFFDFNFTRLEISEKVYRPMSMLQPFFVLGEPFMLKALKELGYKTFDKWFDESYDTTLIDEERFHKVCELTKKLNLLSHVEMSHMLKDMLPVLIHNYELLRERRLSFYYEKRILESIKREFNIT